MISCASKTYMIAVAILVAAVGLLHAANAGIEDALENG